MDDIELRSIDLDVIFENGPGATVTFRIAPLDTLAGIKDFNLEVSVSRQDSHDETVSLALNAVHRLASLLAERTRPAEA